MNLSDDVLIALITVIGGGILALGGNLLAKIGHLGRSVHQVGKDAGIAREQTQNSHTTNLRDDIDRNHKENADAWKATHDTLDVLVDLVSALKDSDVRQWREIDTLNDKRQR